MANEHFDKVFIKIGRGCGTNPDPGVLDARALSEEFDRLATALAVVPPDDLHGATGHRYMVEMLDRAADITRGLSNLPDVVSSLEEIGRARKRRR